MNHGLYVLLGTAATIGFVHTLLGPDHYLPFVALSKARRWSIARTLWVTVLCGVGHVAGSVVLGLIGIAAGITISSLELVESTRGEIAAWLLIAFGLVYGTWGVVRAARGKPHTHVHVHADGMRHVHEHTHANGHTHVHEDAGGGLTAWTVFIVFVLGPCEPLIPLLMFPAAARSPVAVALVAAVFSVVTITTMACLVWLSVRGLALVPSVKVGRYAHAVAGAVILLCGIAIQLGL
jgi:nickel/cobalt exporter